MVMKWLWMASCGCLLRISERFVALDGCKLWISSEDFRDGYGLLHEFDYGPHRCGLEGTLDT